MTSCASELYLGNRSTCSVSSVFVLVAVVEYCSQVPQHPEFGSQGIMMKYWKNKVIGRVIGKKPRIDLHLELGHSDVEEVEEEGHQVVLLDLKPCLFLTSISILRLIRSFSYKRNSYVEDIKWMSSFNYCRFVKQ